jgi:hypothetical protein
MSFKKQEKQVRKPKAKPELQKAITAGQIKKMERKTIKLTGRAGESLGEIERTGSILIYGQAKNGKTNFTMQLAGLMAQHGSVVYNSCEEGFGLSFANTLERSGVTQMKNILFTEKESVGDLIKRLKKRRSPDFVFVDSVNFLRMNTDDYWNLVKGFQRKLFVFVAQEKHGLPKGSTADEIKYNSNIIIRVEGFKAAIEGRITGTKAPITIWEEGAKSYWGI